MRDDSHSGDDREDSVLAAFGWTSFFAEQFHPFRERGWIPGRVAVGHRLGYRLYTAHGEVEAELAGKLRQRGFDSGTIPAVGDWVAISPRLSEWRATIRAMLPRLTKFSRKVRGNAAEEQVVAANVDTVFLVSGLDHDFNLRRLERYLVVAQESGAEPVVVLNKADLCTDVDDRAAQVRTIAPGVAIHAISSLRGDGLPSLAPYLLPARTVAVLGSSGVGKSTLVNRLLGREVLRTGEVRASDSRGRHTTSQRELLLLPSGALIMDTPGLRELQLWEADAGHRAAFDDVEALAERCRFHDCAHRDEPGCAVRQAVADGALSAGRFKNYVELQKELRHLEARIDKRAQRAQKQRDKAVHRLMRHHQPKM